MTGLPGTDRQSDDATPALEVAVVGSGRLRPGDHWYEEAVRLGGLLAREGWTVVTGGYGGLMGAAARGAAEAGGQVVGLPMTPWKHLTPDGNHAELRWSDTYAQRLGHLLATRVTVALPGGIGTLAEASGIWEAAQTEIGAAQLVFVGDAWRRVLATFAAELVIDEDDLVIPIVVDGVDEVVAAARRLIEHPSPRMPSTRVVALSGLANGPGRRRRERAEQGPRRLSGCRHDRARPRAGEGSQQHRSLCRQRLRRGRPIRSTSVHERVQPSALRRRRHRLRSRRRRSSRAPVRARFDRRPVHRLRMRPPSGRRDDIPLHADRARPRQVRRR